MLCEKRQAVVSATLLSGRNDVLLPTLRNRGRVHSQTQQIKMYRVFTLICIWS